MKRAFTCLSIILTFSGATGSALTPQKASSVPESEYRDIQTAIQEGRPASVVTRLQSSLKIHADDLRLRNLLGLAYTALNRLDEADHEFTKALNQDPNFVPALRNLAINEETLGNHQDSISHFRKVVVLRPKDPVASAYLGADRFVHKDYLHAYELLSDVGSLQQNPTIAMEREVSKVVELGRPATDEEAAVVHSLKLSQISPSLVLLGGIALAEQQDNSEAVRFFRELPADWQALPDVTYDLSLCLIRSHQAAEASRTLNAYLATHPHTGTMLSLAAEAYVADGQVQKAIDSLREATVVEPLVEDHYIDLAEICTQYDAYDVGIEVLTVGLHSLPQSERLYFERGVLEAMKNDFESADKDLKQAEQLAPQKSMAGLAIGVQMMQEGHLPEAIRELRAKASRDPNNAVVQYMLAEAIIQNGAIPNSPEMEEARNALMRSAKRDQSYEPPLVALARLNLQARKFGEAHELLLKAVSLSPKDSSAWSQLAIVDHRLGLKDEADDAVKHVSEINQQQRNDRHQLQISSGPPR